MRFHLILISVFLTAASISMGNDGSAPIRFDLLKYDADLANIGQTPSSEVAALEGIKISFKIHPAKSLRRFHQVPSSPEAITTFLASGYPILATIPFDLEAWHANDKKSSKYLEGVVDVPKVHTGQPVSSVTVLIVGYDKENKIYLIKNTLGLLSWASKSKTPGYGTISFDYVTKYSLSSVFELSN